MKSLTLILLLPLATWAQYGGESTFQFLNVTNSAKYESLGGANVSLSDSDLQFATVNPALIDSSLHNQFGGTWGSLFMMQTGIGVGNTHYARSIKGNTYAGEIRMINYGAFESYNEDGQQLPSATASEYVISIGTSREIAPKLSFGANIKPIASYMADYASYAIATDLGLAYTDTAHNLAVGLLVSNLGYQFKPYTEANKESLPVNSQLGITKRLKHAPLRFSITYNYLHQWDISHESIFDQNSGGLLDGEDQGEGWWLEAGENFIKHIVIGTEILIGKNIYGALGYNFKKRNELGLESKAAGAGLSMGLGIKVSHFKLSYGRTKYHAAGATNFISMHTNLDNFFRTKTTIKSNATN